MRCGYLSDNVLSIAEDFRGEDIAELVSLIRVKICQNIHFLDERLVPVPPFHTGLFHNAVEALPVQGPQYAVTLSLDGGCPGRVIKKGQSTIKVECFTRRRTCRVGS